MAEHNEPGPLDEEVAFIEPGDSPDRVVAKVVAMETSPPSVEAEALSGGDDGSAEAGAGAESPSLAPGEADALAEEAANLGPSLEEPGGMAASESKPAPEVEAEPGTSPGKPVREDDESPVDPVDETTSFINELDGLEQEAAAAESRYINAKEIAKECKEDVEAAHRRVMEAIRGRRHARERKAEEARRAEERVKKETPLFDANPVYRAGGAVQPPPGAIQAEPLGENAVQPIATTLADSPAMDDWRSVPLDVIGLSVPVQKILAEQGIAAMGPAFDRLRSEDSPLEHIRKMTPKRIEHLRACFLAVFADRLEQGLSVPGVPPPADAITEDAGAETSVEPDIADPGSAESPDEAPAARDEPQDAPAKVGPDVDGTEPDVAA